jgi:hypothetical protein
MPHRDGRAGAAPRPHVRRRMMAEAGRGHRPLRGGAARAAGPLPAQPGPTAVIPIGSYAGLYPGTADRATARARLGLDSGAAFVYPGAGQHRRLQGAGAVRRRCSAPRRRPDDVALIAGRDRDAGVVRRLRRAAAADPRIRLRVGYVPDDDSAALSGGGRRAGGARSSGSSRPARSSSGCPMACRWWRRTLGCMAELIGDGGRGLSGGGPGGAGAGRWRTIKRADRGRMMSAAARAIAANAQLGRHRAADGRGLPRRAVDGVAT